MFDDIRPYHDSEIPAALRRITQNKYFPLVCEFLFPGKPVKEMAERMITCKGADEFQTRFMYEAIKSVAQKTTDGLTVDGMENLEPGKSYLFVSNHRDIVLDAAFLQVLLQDAGLPTSEITFGANLMKDDFVVDIGKSNKMFRIERPNTVSSARDFLVKSRYVSEYMHYAIAQKHESVWIAQRNGRTKDGIDATDQGIIKMFGMGVQNPENRVDALDSLNICPVSINYEWEPCGVLKALELYAESSGEPYIKKPGEDLTSILTGITQPKGRVHLSVTKPLEREELEALDGLSTGAFNREVAALIDKRITDAFRLWPNNYIAKDYLTGASGGNYTQAQKEEFFKRIDAWTEEYPSAVRDILIKIYAGPLL